MGEPVTRGLLLAVILLLLVPLAAPNAQACLGVPCGRIYPTILLGAPEGAPNLWPVSNALPLAVELTLTYRFDAVNDGYSAASPNDPITITFEFPRKPTWVDMHVEPESVVVDVNNPTRVTPPADPNAPQAFYNFETKIKVTASLVGQPVLRDGFDYAKLLVFAKSSENGLYQSGYGIKELRVVPEGALHESDVAGQRDVYTTTPLPAPNMQPAEVKLGGVTVTATPPANAQFWQPGTWKVAFAPPPSGSVFVALHDEWGMLEASQGPLDASSGQVAFNATLAKPGLHTLTVTTLPAAGSMSPPVTFALDVIAGDTSAEGFAYPKSFLVQDRAPIPAPTGNTVDPTMQWERDVPFFAFDNAQAVAVVVSTFTPGGLDVLRGLANIQFSLLDPDGNLLATSSVDPSQPVKAIRIGSVPTEGSYTLRLRGVGAPTLAWYDVRVEVAYASEPKARNIADGIADVTPPMLSRAGRNVTLPTDDLAVWSSADFTPHIDKADSTQYSTTVYDANGTLAFASGLRSGKSAFTPTTPGTFRAFVFEQPTAGVPFPPIVRAFTFQVGSDRTTVATKYEIHDEPEIPVGPTESFVAMYQLPVVGVASASGGSPENGRLEIVDANGVKLSTLDTLPPGTYFVKAYGQSVVPNAKLVVNYGFELASPATMEGPNTKTATPPSGFSVPAIAVAGIIAALGVAAVAIAMARRP